jgi:hypothetical protein
LQRRLVLPAGRSSCNDVNRSCGVVDAGIDDTACGLDSNDTASHEQAFLDDRQRERSIEEHVRS